MPKGPRCTMSSMSMPYPSNLFSLQSRCSQALLGSSGPPAKTKRTISSCSSALGISEGSSCAAKVMLANSTSACASGPWSGCAEVLGSPRGSCSRPGVGRGDLWGGMALGVTPFCTQLCPLLVSPHVAFVKYECIVFIWLALGLKLSFFATFKL